MKSQGINCILKEKSLDKHLAPRVSMYVKDVSMEIFKDAQKSGSGIRKVLIRGVGYDSSFGYGGIFVTVFKNKKYKLWPAKRARETYDEANFTNKNGSEIQEAVMKLYNDCKKKLGLNKGGIILS